MGAAATPGAGDGRGNLPISGIFLVARLVHVYDAYTTEYRAIRRGESEGRDVPCETAPGRIGGRRGHSTGLDWRQSLNCKVPWLAQRRQDAKDIRVMSSRRSLRLGESIGVGRGWKPCSAKQSQFGQGAEAQRHPGGGRACRTKPIWPGSGIRRRKETCKTNPNLGRMGYPGHGGIME